MTSLLGIAGGGGGCTEAAIPGGDGTIIASGGGTEGNWTNGGLTSVAFDGNANQGQLTGPRSGDSDDEFLGKDWGAGNTHQITTVVCTAPNNKGFHENVDSSMRLRVHEHTSLPSTGAEGTVIGDTGTFTDATGLVKTIACSGGAQKRYHWVRFTGASSPLSKFAICEIEFKGC